MDLRFTTLEMVAVALSVAAITSIADDGDTNWMEGVRPPTRISAQLPDVW